MKEVLAVLIFRVIEVLGLRYQVAMRLGRAILADRYRSQFQMLWSARDAAQSCKVQCEQEAVPSHDPPLSAPAHMHTPVVGAVETDWHIASYDGRVYTFECRCGARIWQSALAMKLGQRPAGWDFQGTEF